MNLSSLVIYLSSLSRVHSNRSTQYESSSPITSFDSDEGLFENPYKAAIAMRTKFDSISPPRHDQEFDEIMIYGIEIAARNFRLYRSKNKTNSWFESKVCICCIS